MANERDDEREEDRPRIVDNRRLSNDERQGFGPVLIGGATGASATGASATGASATGASATGDTSTSNPTPASDSTSTLSAASGSDDAPHLEIIGGGAEPTMSDTTMSDTMLAEVGEDDGDADGAMEMDEEALREQIEATIQEQLEAAAQQLGRPLTGKEREQVRAQVEAQIQAQIMAQMQGGAIPGGVPGEPEMSPEEQEAMRLQMEEEQFATIQGQIGRELTEQEKDQVRAQMEEQAQAAISLEVAPVLLDLMVKLPNYAAVHLGLTPNPYTQLIARNDANAKLSIDALGSMFDIIKPMLDNPSRREFERVINDLRVNYTRITGQPIGPTGGPSLITGPRLIR